MHPDDCPFVPDDIVLHLQDELDRKVNETLIDILSRQQDHLYTAREARIAMRTLFSAAQGLISEEYSETLNNAMTEVARAEDKAPLPAFLFYKGNVVMLDADRESHQVKLKMISPAGSVVAQEFDYPDEATTFKGAVTRLIGLVKNGAKRV